MTPSKRITPYGLFRMLREEMNLSQREFGELFGLHQTSISRIEQGVQLPDIYEVQKAFRIAMERQGKSFAAFEQFFYGDWI